MQKHESASPVIGDNPSDAPLRSETYSYEISVRVNCAVLFGRYESDADYFPSMLAPNRSIPVTIEKGDMIFEVPGYGELKVPIVKRKRDRRASCGKLPAASGRVESRGNQGIAEAGE